MQPLNLLAFVPAAFLLLANSPDEDIEPFRLTAEDGYFVADGTLVPETGDHIDRVRTQHRDITVLVMDYVPGSDDDNDYLEAAAKLHQDGFTTIIPADGMIASGGTDFFLAGRYRIIEPGACIGVHSWEDVGPPSYQATDLPKEHEDHKEYLEYFKAIGVSGDFYWFTIKAAAADGMHWMSPAEINRFGMSTEPVPDNGETAEQRNARCDRRAEEG